MKILQSINTIAIIGLLLLFLWQWNKNKAVSTKTEIHYIHDRDSSMTTVPIEIRTTPGSIPTSIPVYITIPPTPTTPGRIDTVYKPLDSLEVVKAFFTNHYYSDTAKTKFGSLWYNFKVSQNRADSGKFGWDIVTKEIIRQKGQLYLGIEGLGDQKTFLNGAGVNLAWKTPGSKQYEIGVVKIQGMPLQKKVGFKMLLSLKK